MLKTKPLKSKKLTQASNGESCIRCGAPDAYACHYNGTWQQAYGKGRGIKCSDLATADLCHTCDNVFTEGSTSGFDNQYDRDAQFHHLVMLTNIRRIEKGVLKVA